MKTPDELREQFWLEDSLSGNIIRKQYDEIKSVLSKEDMTWANDQLRKIKIHALENVPFYQKIGNIDLFPVLKKRQILDHYDEHRAIANDDKPIHISSTSGSTGTPFSVEQNYTKRKRAIADLQVFGELADYPIRERMIVFRIISSRLNRTPERENKENIYYIDTSDLSELNLKNMVEAILEKKPCIVFSYPSTLILLAKYIMDHDIRFTESPLKSVLAAGETLTEENRIMIKNAFGCKVYNRYSDMELGTLAQDRGDGGEFVLNWGSYYFECLKQDSDEPAGENEAGRIVITDLFNYAFPMIRYDTGDIGIMTKKGKGLPTIKEIYGRSDECVYDVEGKMISNAKITVAMWGVKGIKQFRFIQENETEYVIKIHAEKDVDEDMLVNKYMDILGSRANIRIEYVDEIPALTSNKRRAVVCNIRK